MARHGTSQMELDREGPDGSISNIYDAGSSADHSPDLHNPNQNPNNAINGSSSAVGSGREGESSTTDSRRNGVSHRQNRGNNGSQSDHRHKDVAQALKKACEQLTQCQQTLQCALIEPLNLVNKYVSDFDEIPTLRQKVVELDAQSKASQDSIASTLKEKDERITNQKKAIEELTVMVNEKKRLFEQQMTTLENEKTKLEERKKEYEDREQKGKKRLEDREAKQKLDLEKTKKAHINKLEKELREATEKHDEQLKLRKQDLEKEFAKQKEEIAKNLTESAATNSALTLTIDEQKKQIAEQEHAMTKSKDMHDDDMGIIELLKKERKSLKQRLETVENEFDLNTQPLEFYEKKFSDIEENIRRISGGYLKSFNDESSEDNEDNEDTEKIREKLIEVDRHFMSMPISNSTESQELRKAHIQRVISSCFEKIIWQPFSSEETIENPEIADFLTKMFKRRAAKPNSHGSSRSSAVWRALAIRKLQSESSSSQSIPPPSPPASPGTSFVPSKVALGGHGKLATKVIEEIMRVVNPLLDPSQEANFRQDILSVVQDAYSVWIVAQTGTYEINFCSQLDPARRSEWRPLDYDHPSSDSVSMHTVPATHPRVFSLFPEITARKLYFISEKTEGPPGSFPEPNEPSQMAELRIHTGVGLAEWSPLVIRGKEEVKEIEDEFRRLKKQARNKRNGPSRKTSTADPFGSTTPASPTTPNLPPGKQWSAMGGTMTSGEA